MIARSFVILAVVGVCWAATFQGYLPKKPAELAHKEGCYVQEIKDVVPFGAEVTPIGYCYRINCGRRMMNYASCGVVDTSETTCYVTKGDLTVGYPHCCPTIKCEAENNV